MYDHGSTHNITAQLKFCNHIIISTLGKIVHLVFTLCSQVTTMGYSFSSNIYKEGEKSFAEYLNKEKVMIDIKRLNKEAGKKVEKME